MYFFSIKKLSTRINSAKKRGKNKKKSINCHKKVLSLLSFVAQTREKNRNCKQKKVFFSFFIISHSPCLRVECWSLISQSEKSFRISHWEWVCVIFAIVFLTFFCLLTFFYTLFVCELLLVVFVGGKKLSFLSYDREMEGLNFKKTLWNWF